MAFGLATASLLLTGCASTWRSPGAEGADTKQLAILTSTPTQTVVVGINGKRPGFGVWGRFELQPGITQLDVAPNAAKVGTIKGGSVRIGFQAEAGRQYRLLAGSVYQGEGNVRWRPWIVDEATGKTVSKPVQ